MPHLEQEMLTLPEHLSSHPVLRVVRVARFLVFYCMFCRSLFVHLSFFFWPLFSIDLRLLVIPLVSSSFKLFFLPLFRYLYTGRIRNISWKYFASCIGQSLSISNLTVTYRTFFTVLYLRTLKPMISKYIFSYMYSITERMILFGEITTELRPLLTAQTLEPFR